MLAVAVAVAERRHPAAEQAAARRGVEVATGRDGQVPHVVEVARHHAGAEPVGEAEPSVVGGTGRPGPSGGEGDQGDERNHGERGATAGGEDERHETTPFLRPASGEPRAPGARFQDSRGPKCPLHRLGDRRLRGHFSEGPGPVSEGKWGRNRGFRGKNRPKIRFSEGKQPFPYCKFAAVVYCLSR